MGLEFPRLDLGFRLPMKKKLPPADSNAEVLSDLRRSGSGLPASGFGITPADEKKTTSCRLDRRNPLGPLAFQLRPLASGYPLPMKKKLPPADSTAKVHSDLRPSSSGLPAPASRPPASGYPLPMKKKLPPADSNAEVLSRLRHSGPGIPAPAFRLRLPGLRLRATPCR